MSRPIPFEYQYLPAKGYTVVALDSRLEDYDFKPAWENNKLVMKSPERTVKDCRHIDGCVYYHLGYVPDSVMVDLIEKFQKLKQETGWKPGKGIMDNPDSNLEV